jgi:hypothetical protein
MVDIVDVVDRRPAGIIGQDAEDLGVVACLVVHAEHTDRTGPQVAAGEGGLVEEHERVERVAIAAQGVADESVVGRVGGGGEQVSVEPELPGHVVHLVLVSRTLRNLDDHFDSVLRGHPPILRAHAHRANAARARIHSARLCAWSPAGVSPHLRALRCRSGRIVEVVVTGFSGPDVEVKLADGRRGVIARSEFAEHPDGGLGCGRQRSWPGTTRQGGSG